MGRSGGSGIRATEAQSREQREQDWTRAAERRVASLGVCGLDTQPFRSGGPAGLAPTRPAAGRDRRQYHVGQ